MQEKEVEDRTIRRIISTTFPEETAREQLNALLDILVQAALFSKRGLTVKNLASMQSVSGATICNRLKLLDAYELVKREKIGREIFLALDLYRLGELAD